ncbi:AbrB family transcriptional regulator [Sinomonas notoginsengisoli]|uniref:AbrB family transcriptional regulator n=1 Tax=Sinomonas notoginsengisoli TaxID=1457311 RepID=UPI001F2CE48B|nr:AbrB family transcriptional regulator [Sinomonas notoginsengisoli]
MPSPRTQVVTDRAGTGTARRLLAGTLSRSRLGSAAVWLAPGGAAFALGETGSLIGLPAPHLLLALLVGAAAALSGAVKKQLPKPAAVASQAGIGVLMGSYITPASLQSAGAAALPMTAVTVLTIGLCLAAGSLLARWGRTGLADGALSLVPGGSAAVVAAADDLGADSRVVAFSQYFRVALVAFTAPLVAFALHPVSGGNAGPGGTPLWDDPHQILHLSQNTHQLPGLLMLAAVCILGVRAGRRISMPAPALLGPMVITALFVFTGTAQGFAPDGALRSLLFVLVGLEVGLRFTWASVRSIGRLFPHVLLWTVAVCFACGGLAWAFSAALGLPLLDAYLATTPGGINAVLATAASLDANLPAISTVQSIRLFIVMLLTPPLISWLAHKNTPKPALAAATPGKHLPVVTESAVS